MIESLVIYNKEKINMTCIIEANLIRQKAYSMGISIHNFYISICLNYVCYLLPYSKWKLTSAESAIVTAKPNNFQVTFNAYLNSSYVAIHYQLMTYQWYHKVWR